LDTDYGIGTVSDLVSGIFIRINEFNGQVFMRVGLLFKGLATGSDNGFGGKD
jgi:hypothetical protein